MKSILSPEIQKKYQKHNTLPIKYIGWDPEFEELPREATVSLKGEKVDVVINLQGENISAKRWSQNKKIKSIIQEFMEQKI